MFLFNFIIFFYGYCLLITSDIIAEFKEPISSKSVTSNSSSTSSKSSFFAIPSFLKSPSTSSKKTSSSSKETSSPTTVTKNLDQQSNLSFRPDKQISLQIPQDIHVKSNLQESPQTKKLPVAIRSKTADIIDAWLEDYPQEVQDNMYVQNNLQNDITNLIFRTNPKTQARDLIDPTTNVSNIKKQLLDIATIYKDHKNISNIINNVVDTITLYEKSQSKIAIDAKQSIIPFIPRDQALDICKALDITPEFNTTTGTITNMPSIEAIKEGALENPTQKTFTMLNQTLKAIYIAKDRIQQDSSFGSQKIIKQLTKYETELYNTLAKPSFDAYKSFALKNMLDVTQLGNMTIESLLNYFKPGMDLASKTADQFNKIKSDPTTQAASYFAVGMAGFARMQLSGAIIDLALYHIMQEHVPSAIENLKKMTLNQFMDIISPSEKTSILNAQENRKFMESDTITITGELKKLMSGSNKQQIEQAQLNANNEIKNFYYEPELQQAVLQATNTKPIIDSKTGVITNFPSIETIISAAQQNPSKESYNALQAAIKATDTALIASRYDVVDWVMNNSLKVEQLFLYKDQLMKAIENPSIIRFKNSFKRASDYATSFIPKSQDIAKATGIMDTTFEELAQGNTNTNRLINMGLQYNNTGKTTMNEVLQSARMLP